MAGSADTHPHRPTVAHVDRLIDENGSPIKVPEDSELSIARNAERSVAATSPTNWWRAGLIALGVVAFILLMLQIFGGNPGTNVQPGTPVAAPQQPAPQP